jgi:hypothetical protein
MCGLSTACLHLATPFFPLHSQSGNSENVNDSSLHPRPSDTGSKWSCVLYWFICSTEGKKGLSSSLSSFLAVFFVNDELVNVIGSWFLESESVIFHRLLSASPQCHWKFHCGTHWEARRVGVAMGPQSRGSLSIYSPMFLFYHIYLYFLVASPFVTDSKSLCFVLF